MVEIKTEIDGIYRDVNTGALLNKNNDGLSAYKKAKQKNQELENMKETVNNLTNEIEGMKNILNRILEKVS